MESQYRPHIFDTAAIADAACADAVSETSIGKKNAPKTFSRTNISLVQLSKHVSPALLQYFSLPISNKKKNFVS